MLTAPAEDEPPREAGFSEVAIAVAGDEALVAYLRWNESRDVAVEVQRIKLDGTLIGDPAVVRPILAAELDPPRPAPRPSNSVLANEALQAAGIPLLRDHVDPLTELITQLRA